MEKRYSIVVNEIDNKYVIVYKSWELDEEGNKINVENFAKRGLTLNEVKEIIEKL